MKWVEKSSIEKIRRLLEISERERHCQVLLTRENIYVVRNNPAPYTLPVIPRPLPSNVVEGEHFVLTDVRRLASSSVSSSRDLVVEASSQVQGARSSLRSPTSLSRVSDSSSTTDREAIGQGFERVLPLTQVAKAAPRVVKVKRKRALKRRNALGSRSEDFVPWIPNRSNDSQNLEEDEHMEREAGLLDRYATRKRKRQVSSSGESDAAPVPSADLGQPVTKDQPTADGSSGDRVITILGSPELGPSIGPELDRSESNEDDPASRALQIIPPSYPGEGSRSRSEFTCSGMPKPKRPDHVITHNYIPPRGPKPPRVEISAPGRRRLQKYCAAGSPFISESLRLIG